MIHDDLYYVALHRKKMLYPVLEADLCALTKKIT